MVATPIAFRCPHCSILLTVPAKESEVEGPCPKCSRVIRAPLPPSNPGFPVISPSQAPTETMPQYGAKPQALFPSPTTGRSAIPASVPITPRIAPVQPTNQDTAPSTPKEKPEPSGHREIRPKRSQQTKHIPKRILLRSMMPLIFAGAAVVLIFGVLQLLKRQGKSADTASPSNEASSTSDDNSSNQGDPSDTSGNTPAIHTSSTPSDTNDSSQPPPVEQVALRPSAASEALAVLERFLKAPSLEERIPMIETMDSEGDLTNTVLASRLPTFRNLVIDSQQSFALENIVDFYFTFEFINKDGSPDPQTVVVRRRAEMNPRVLADPFLDLYGGRLAAFAAKPQSKGQLFHAIVYPLPTCNDLRIPDRQKKITLRLYSHENSQNVTLAYASRISQIGEMLTTGNYDLSYGKSLPCVILLGWNTEESPDTPYLEALDVKAAHWNP